MKKNPEVSVVVPVYNVEKWLPKCLDSILGQTYGDFELILVNDGSADGSLEICRAYETKDKRVRVIDGPNRGSSAARNIGLEQAQGNWIIFCDSDDWWDIELLEKLHIAAIDNDADIAACEIVWEYADKGVVEAYAYSSVETDVDKAYIGTVYCSLCNKLVNIELYRKYKIKGTPGIKMWDDVMISTLLRYYSKKTIIINEPLYHYNRMVETSQLLRYSSASDKYPEEQIDVVRRLESYFKSNGNFDKVAKGIICGCQAYLYIDVNDIVRWRDEFPHPIFSYSVINTLFDSKKAVLKYSVKVLIPRCFLSVLHKIIKHKKK